MPKVEKPTPVAVAEPPASQSGPPKKEKRKRGRPFKGTDRIPMVMQFWHRVEAYDPADWGKRVWITMYRLRPLIDRARSGQPKKVGKFGVKIDEEWIKQNHGSGSYRLYLNYKAPEADEKEVDTVDVDIFDPSYPPNIPDEEFLKIPENADWEWCRPLLRKIAQPGAPAAAPASTAPSDIMGAVRMGVELGNRGGDADERPSLLETIQAVKLIMPTPAPATDNKMLETIVALMNAQLDRMSRDNSELRKEISDSRKNPEAKSPLSMLTELIAEAKKLDILPEGGLKSLFKSAEGALQTVTRSRMTGTEEFLQPILVQFAEAAKPVIPMLVHRWMQPQQPAQQQPGTAALPQAQQTPAQQPAPNGAAPPTNGAPPAATAAPDAPQFDPQQALVFFSNFAQAFVKFFQDEQSGGDFAAYIYEGYGADWQGVKWLWLKTQVPATRIVQGFKAMPLWPEIAAAEPQFTEYAQQFIDWQPAAADTTVDMQPQQEPVQ